mgnify:CR=1 FL=1
MSTKFTEKAENALNRAVRIAEGYGHTYVGSEHILLGIMRCGDGRAANILSSFGLDYEGLIAKITEEDILAGTLVSKGSKLRILVNKATGLNPHTEEYKEFMKKQEQGKIQIHQ